MKRKIPKIPDIVILFILIIISLVILSFFKMEKIENEPAYKNDFHKRYSVYALEMPDSLSFAGENVPLGFIDVKEELDRELLVNTYWQSHTILLIKRANKYFPVIESILKTHGIPDDFKYMAVAESDLMNIISPVNAVGIWQFLEPTAIEYGLEVTEEVDERYHIEKSTEAVCKYLRDSYAKYQNWTLVAASYNMGRNGIEQQIEKQMQNNYYNLLLNDETARYVYRILALKLIISNPSNYGFKINEEDMYYSLPYYEAEVDSTIENLAVFACQQGTNYKLLRILNPWLRGNSLTNNDQKKYIIKILEENGRSSSACFERTADIDTTVAGEL